ncbi:MAG: type II toxin-antitoxin system VapC family toxin [Nitrospira sp.]|nr:type II toxin-antitoxin system VapC family toxin [Nitrospira sp.]
MVGKDIKDKIIGIDTMIFIYHLEDHPDYALSTEKIFEAVERGKYNAVTSVITLLEILVKPKRDGNLTAVKDYKDLLLTFPHLTVIDLNVKISDIASDLRAKYNIKTPDAVQIATTIFAGSKSFITNDESLKKVNEVRFLLLDEIGKTL